MTNDVAANMTFWFKGVDAFSALISTAAPALVIKSEPFAVLAANPSALALFGQVSLAGLTSHLASNHDAGSRRLQDLAASSKAIPPRLERLRFALAGSTELVTFLCSKLVNSDQDYLLAAAMGLHPALQKDIDAAVLAAKSGPEAVETGAAAPVIAPPAALKPLRFLFLTDAEGKVSQISPEFATTGLVSAQAMLGKSLADILPLAAPILTATLASRKTWRHEALMWPLQNGSGEVPVTVAASPMLNPDKVFAGFRGFGIAHFEQTRPAQPEVGVALATALPPTTAHVPTAHVPTAHVPAADVPATDLAGAGPAAPVADHLLPVQHVVPTEQTQPAAVLPEPPAPDQTTLTSEFTQEHLIPIEKPEPLLEKPEAPRQHVLTPAPLFVAPGVPDTTATAFGNVVSLHPDRVALPDSGAVPGHFVARDTDIVPLSAAERLAFREIAKALGAKGDADDQIQLKATKTPDAKPTGTKPVADKPVEAVTHVLAPLADIQARIEPVPAAMAPPAQEPSVAAAPMVALTLPGPEASSTPHVSVQPVAVPDPLPIAPKAGPTPAESTSLLDMLPLGVWIIQNDKPVYANAALLNLLGHEPASHTAVERAQLSAAALQAPMDWTSGEKPALSLVNVREDHIVLNGSVRDYVWNAAPARLVFLRRPAEPDLNPRLKSLELDLRARESEARELHGILDTATDGIAVLDDTGHILAVNRSAEALLGYEQNEVLGALFTVLLAPESHAAALDYLDGLKSNGVASVLNDGRDVLGRERHGGLVPMFMTLGRVGQGANAKFCAVLRDVTHWKKAECELRDARQEAERTSAQKSDFLAKISHEIRTPLNAILGFTEVIWQERFGPIGNERYKDYLKDIHASGTLVMSLVNDLLDLSKIESGNLDLAFASVNANTILQDCVALMQPQATKERVIIRVSLAPRLPNIVADERSLRQIMLNLLSNAVKFNEPGGQVIVSTALTDAGHAVIRIRDTGIGMNENDIERALEPFRQLETSRKSHGSGLGLPLTKAMVEANRAAFTIKSKRGEGTLAEVTFPPTRVLAE